MDASEAAGEPKKLVTFDGPHYGAYSSSHDFELCAGAAVDWFRTHL